MNQGIELQKEEGLLKSTFQQTIQLLQDRRLFFKINHLSNQTQLNHTNGHNLRTVSELLPGLAVYMLNQSPVQPALRDLYTSQYDEHRPRCILPPASEGEQSINEPASKQPPFKWLTGALIDSTMLEIDQPEPKKADKLKTPPEWEKKYEILVFDISKKIHLKEETRSIDNYFRENIERFSGVRIRKIKFIYYKGKPSIILHFSSEYGSSFAYYNLSVEKYRKENLGMNSQVYRIAQNRLKSIGEQKSVYLLFRNLPLILNKQGFVEQLKKRKLNPIWMQQLVQIQNFKYTLCKVQYLQSAFEICTEFQINPPYKGIKVNLHPKSSKTWEVKATQDLSINPSF